MEGIGGRRIQLWDEPQSKTREMTWCNDSDDNERAIRIISPPIPKDATAILTTTEGTKATDEFGTITCPSCGHRIEFQDQVLYDLSFFFCVSSKLYSFLCLIVLCFGGVVKHYRLEYMICQGCQLG